MFVKMLNMYKVFEIDKAFDRWSADTVIVGGKSVEDILEHFDEIFPPFVDNVTREDWMNDECWDDITEYGKYKEGDVKVEKIFTDEQMNLFRESLNKDNPWPRIKEIKHLFTDTPYTRLTGFGWIE